MLTQHVYAHLRHLGIEKPATYLTDKGIPYHTVHRLFKGRIDQMSFPLIEKLCLVCNCTPNELFAWSEDEGKTIPAEHPLRQLKRFDAGPTPLERVKKLSPEKLEELQKMLDLLENN